MVRVNNEHDYGRLYDALIAMSATRRQSRTVTLSPPLEEQWTLHHVLLDRIEREAEEPASVDSPPVEAYRAFERLDDGRRSFTVAQVEAMRTIIAEYHHSPEWEHDRSRLERLLRRLSDRLEEPQSARLAD